MERLAVGSSQYVAWCDQVHTSLKPRPLIRHAIDHLAKVTQRLAVLAVAQR